MLLPLTQLECMTGISDVSDSLYWLIGSKVEHSNVSVEVLDSLVCSDQASQAEQTPIMTSMSTVGHAVKALRASQLTTSQPNQNLLFKHRAKKAIAMKERN